MTSRLLQSLSELTLAHPLERKRLVGPDVNYGRELLVALARETGGWVGWEATNLRGVAEALSFVPLARQGVRAASDVRVKALVDRALVAVSERRLVSNTFSELSGNPGFRRALRDTVLELRTAGVVPSCLRRDTPANSPTPELAAVLEEYEALLSHEHLADAAGIFRAALHAFDGEASFELDGVIALAPGLSARGLPGELLGRLVDRGAQILIADHPAGLIAPNSILTPADERRDSARSLLGWLHARPLQRPDDDRLGAAMVSVDLFAASTPAAEVREICRRIVAEGLRWDEVEIVVTDLDAYGVALGTLSEKLGIGATMLHGVPLARTRLGRVLERWFAWLENGLSADILRQALEAGELHLPGAGISSVSLAAELQSLRVGWGRERYEVALRRLDGAPLALLLRALLDAAPEVPERGSLNRVQSSASALARGTLAYLDLVPLHGEAEAQTAERLRAQLEELALVNEEQTSFANSLTMLRDALGDLRAWPMSTGNHKPWSACGGCLHLTDVQHAGTTGRRRVFVAGLDAGRTGGSGQQDPLMPDSARRVIAGGRLNTSSENRERDTFKLASALATLRGRVTLSYATSGTLDGREAGPAQVLLQAARMTLSEHALSYEELRHRLRPPTSAVPARRDSAGAVPGALLDARDVWLDAIGGDDLLLDASAAVRVAFPMFGAGISALEIAGGAELTAFHGLVAEGGGRLDRLAHPEGEISPSSLETLAACPLAWLYRYGLRLRTVDDPEYDEERWLNHRQRGALLHELYETFGREYQGRQHEIGDERASNRVLEIASDCMARWRELVPPPGELVFEAECARVRRDALAFLQMARSEGAHDGGGQWHHVELMFGSGAIPGICMLDSGTALKIRGRADRVDLLPDGTLRVVDYKTGKADDYGRQEKKGAFNGGRQLQPAVYAAAVESISGLPVSSFEYRFPTEAGQNQVVRYTAAELASAREIVASLIGHVRAGEFIPTNDCADCRHCDYAEVCRASHEGYGKVDTPRARWAKENAGNLPAYAALLARRRPAPQGSPA